MNSGDRLASGARTASFQAKSNGREWEYDLKSMTPNEFMAKYDVEESGYEAFVAALECGDIDMSEPPSLRMAGKASMPNPAAEQPPVVQIREIEKPRYKGKARGDNVLVTRVEREHSSMLIIPESARAKSDIGRAADVGPQVMRCSVGELVLFDRFAAHGKEIELVDDEGIARQHLLLNDADILLGLERL